MLTGCVGQVDVTERTEVTETTGEVGGKVLEFERATTLLALRDWMIPARPEQQGAFGRSQHQVARRLRSSPPESSTMSLLLRHPHQATLVSRCRSLSACPLT